MKELFRKVKKLLTLAICGLLVFEMVNCGAMLVNAEGETMSALFYILKPGVEKPSENPIQPQPEENYTAGIQGEVYAKDPENGEDTVE